MQAWYRSGVTHSLPPRTLSLLFCPCPLCRCWQGHAMRSHSGTLRMEASVHWRPAQSRGGCWLTPGTSPVVQRRISVPLPQGRDAIKCRQYSPRGRCKQPVRAGPSVATWLCLTVMPQHVLRAAGPGGQGNHGGRRDGPYQACSRYVVIREAQTSTGPVHLRSTWPIL